MLKELFTYVIQKNVLPVARSFGHLYESISLIEREKRCRPHWLSHRENSKQFIIQQCQSLVTKKSILVMGSGPLHEIPIEWLSENFEDVFLLDIVHLQSVKKKCEKLKNLHFIVHDISEVEEEIQKSQMLVKKIPVFLNDRPFSCVISANVMSQIPLHLHSYIAKNLSNLFTAEEIDDFLLESTRAHLQYLHSFQSPLKLLITDTETFYYDESGSLKKSYFNYSHLNLPPAKSEWIWNVAPIPEISKTMEMKMKVAGFVLNRKKQ